MHLGISENSNEDGIMIHGEGIASSGIHIVTLTGIAEDGIKSGTKAMVMALVLALPLRRRTGAITASKINHQRNASRRSHGAIRPGTEKIILRNAT